jgi:hypothetical protein
MCAQAMFHRHGWSIEPDALLRLRRYLRNSRCVTWKSKWMDMLLWQSPFLVCDYWASYTLSFDASFMRFIEDNPNELDADLWYRKNDTITWKKSKWEDGPRDIGVVAHTWRISSRSRCSWVKHHVEKHRTEYCIHRAIDFDEEKWAYALKEGSTMGGAS